MTSEVDSRKIDYVSTAILWRITQSFEAMVRLNSEPYGFQSYWLDVQHQHHRYFRTKQVIGRAPIVHENKNFL